MFGCEKPAVLILVSCRFPQKHFAQRVMLLNKSRGVQKALTLENLHKEMCFKKKLQFQTKRGSFKLGCYRRKLF